MNYCDHCDGQRFDRARVLTALRQLRRQLRATHGPECDATIAMAVATIRALDIPHLDPIDVTDEVIH